MMMVMMMIESIHSLLIMLITILIIDTIIKIIYVIELTVNFIVVFIGVLRLIILLRDLPPTCTHTCLLWLPKPQAEPVLDNRGDIGAWALIHFPDWAKETIRLIGIEEKREEAILPVGVGLLRDTAED